MPCSFLACVSCPESGPRGLGFVGAGVVPGTRGGHPRLLDVIVNLDSAASSWVAQGQSLDLSETRGRELLISEGWL